MVVTLTDQFTILEAQNPSIDVFYEAKKMPMDRFLGTKTGKRLAGALDCQTVKCLSVSIKEEMPIVDWKKMPSSAPLFPDPDQKASLSPPPPPFIGLHAGLYLFFEVVSNSILFS